MAKQNIKEIQEAIANAGHSWQASENQFFRMSDQEKDKFLGYTPGPNDEPLDVQERISAENYAAFKSALLAGDNHGFTAPAQFDWRNNGGLNYVTPIKNQSSCGSCVAFGTIAAVESRIKIQRGAAFNVDLSEAHLFHCIARSQGRNCANGWWPENALIGFRDIGVADEACYPYTPADQNCTNRCADWANRVTKISGYAKVNGINDIKEWIASKGPIEACFSVYADFYSYTSGVYKKASTDLRGGHCVCIVGYSDALECWICKNSWGAGFGESGFFRIGYGQCGIEGQVYGANSVVGSYDINAKKVTGLWANNENRNAWAYISDIGWKKISNNNDIGFTNLLTDLATAKTVGSTVNLTIDETEMISVLYVF